MVVSTEPENCGIERRILTIKLLFQIQNELLVNKHRKQYMCSVHGPILLSKGFKATSHTSLKFV